ncbi:MAG: DNA-binding domain-containing protein [Crocinitomicaceae bacterium]|nr:DNA-binding domain-containing protein [Crocinitomicaceae bacterium]
MANGHSCCFDGKITPISKSGGPIIEKQETVLENLSISGKADITPPSDIEKALSNDNPPISSYESIPVSEESDEVKVISASEKASNIPQTKLPEENQDIISSEQARKIWACSSKVKQEELMKNHFIAWMIKGIEKKKLRVNEAKAPVHILEHHVALVTPSIFIKYFGSNSLKKISYEKRAGDKKIFTLLQKELESLDIHHRSTSGQNMVKILVVGPRKTTEVTAYLLDRRCFPSLNSFSANKAMKIKV